MPLNPVVTSFAPLLAFLPPLTQWNLAERDLLMLSQAQLQTEAFEPKHFASFLLLLSEKGSPGNWKGGLCLSWGLAVSKS